MEAQFPDNLHLLLHRARAEQERGDTQAAHHAYQRAHALDAHNMTGMDRFAMLAKDTGVGTEEVHINDDS